MVKNISYIFIKLMKILINSKKESLFLLNKKNLKDNIILYWCFDLPYKLDLRHLNYGWSCNIMYLDRWQFLFFLLFTCSFPGFVQKMVIIIKSKSINFFRILIYFISKNENYKWNWSFFPKFK